MLKQLTTEKQSLRSAFFLATTAGRCYSILCYYSIPYFFLKRSTRPPESTNLCTPVKNGWHLEQISTLISFLVLPVSIVLPQAQVMVV